MTQQTTLIDGLAFSEGPRWREGEFWFSDIHGGQVHRVTLDESRPALGVKSDTIVADFEDSPSGLGWLPDGSLLVVAMESGRLLKVDASGTVSQHADCSGLARGSLNDMIVRADGTAYVGDMGARIFDEHPDHSVPGQTLMVTPGGEVSCAADDLGAPNGHILTPDEQILYIGESARGRITAFDVAADGTLSGQRIFADLPPAEGFRISPPDGICLDAEGAIWSADPVAKRLIRVRPGGEIMQTVEFDGATVVAAALGGADRRTLLACVTDDWRREGATTRRRAKIVAVAVDVPGAGKP
ncbi:MAG TPA: SMP-30/gluconolactonase/LRE family protein [Frankiaceae bacterium]|jgi:sugar lactone lactonase YvrE|nr:SMP-30/gluconolactonase/LRE family protein [Frankiaceae bacterium]